MRAFLMALLKFSAIVLFGPVMALFVLAPGLPVFIGAVLTVILVIGLALILALLTMVGARKISQVMQNASLPRSISQAVADSRRYGRLIMQTARQYPPGPMQDRLKLTLRPVERWLESLSRLEQGLSRLYSQRHLERELRQVGTEMEQLRQQLLVALEPEAKYLRDLMESKKQHQAALKELKLFQTQAELRIRKIASDLSTTHAEMLLIVARGDFNDNRFHRLDENLQENLAGLRDMLATMDELGYTNASA